MFRKSKLAAQSKKSDNNKSSNSIDTKTSVSSTNSTGTNNSSSHVFKRIFGRKSKLMKASKSPESCDVFVNNDIQTSVATSKKPVVPIICEEGMVASTCVTPNLNSQSRSTTTTAAAATVNNEAHLLKIPSANRDRSRNSSDNDSAVDVNFNDEWSSDNLDVQHRNKYSIRSGDTCSSQIIDEGNISCSRCSSSSATAQVEEAKNSVAPNKVLNKIVRTESMTSWRKIKAALVWTPFIQHCARHQYPWIQIAGHQGNFKPGEQGTILKKHCGRESICLQTMRDDALCSFIPEFKSEVDYEGDKYICMQDLLAQFHKPSLMDVKMGIRTYLEEELVKAKECPKPRQDMYEKMIAVDKGEPTEEEHRLRAVLKPRYMIWRETLSSTVTMGFRIEGVKNMSMLTNDDKVVGTQSRSFKKTKYRDEVKKVLTDFIDGKLEILSSFIVRLKSIEKQLMKSNFFWAHEFIGSSLLFVYDETQKADIWMIDFGKTVPLPPGISVDHYSNWCEGNHEDGYLFGLQKLMVILEEIRNELTVATASSSAAAVDVVIDEDDDDDNRDNEDYYVDAQVGVDSRVDCSSNDPPIK